MKQLLRSMLITQPQANPFMSLNINRIVCILGLFILMCVSQCNAQYYWEEPNRLGIKVGPSVSQMLISSNRKGSESPYLGYQIGFFALLPIQRHFTIQTELLFHRKGSNVNTLTNADPKTGPDYKFRFSYLELPVVASYVSGPLHIGAGPYVGYRVGGRAEGFAGSDTTYPVFTASGTKRFDYGLIGDVALRNDVYIIGLRGQYGLSSLAGTAQNLTLVDKARFLSGVLYLGLMF